MSDQNGTNGLPMAWPQAVQGGSLFGTTPPAWTGATAADAVAAAQAASQPVPQVVTGGSPNAQPVGEVDKSPAELVAEGRANQARKKALKLAEKELRKKWATPWDRFNGWNAEFQFTLDACADASNAKVPRFIGPGSPLGMHDALAVQALPGERIWCNAPGFDESYVKWCWQLMGQSKEQRPKLIVQIRPANQTDQPFWLEYVERYRDWNGYAALQPLGIDFRIRFLTPRVEFVPPTSEKFMIEGVEETVEIKESSPRSGHVLLIWKNL